MAPAFTLSRLDAADGKLSLAELKGKPVVVNFWACWCIPCKGEAPALQKTYEKYKAQGLTVLGIDAQDFRGDARSFAKRFGLTYPVVYDGSGSTLGKWGVTGFPETFFVDRSGRLVGEQIQGGIDTERNKAAYQQASRRRSAPAMTRLAAGLLIGLALFFRRCRARRPAEPGRSRDRDRLPDMPHDAGHVDVADRHSDEGVHPHGHRPGQDRSPDQGRARRPVRPRRAGGAAEEWIRPPRVAASPRRARGRCGGGRRPRLDLEPASGSQADEAEPSLDPDLERRVDEELARFED